MSELKAGRGTMQFYCVVLVHVIANINLRELIISGPRLMYVAVIAPLRSRVTGNVEVHRTIVFLNP